MVDDVDSDTDCNDDEDDGGEGERAASQTDEQQRLRTKGMTAGLWQLNGVKPERYTLI